MTLSEQRILVTGGAGFIGSEVVRQLSLSGAHVIVIDNLSCGNKEYVSGLPNVNFIEGDICNRNLVARILKRVDAVINLAALTFVPDSYYYPERFFEVNVTGTMNLLMEAVKLKTLRRFVQISSSEVYGSARIIPMNEEHPLFPHSTYAVSKLAADRLAFTVHKEQGLPVTIVRPFNCFGPRVTQPYVVAEIAIQLLNGNNHIRLGNLESIRDFTYVSDTAEGIIISLNSDELNGQTMNLGTGQGIKIRELAYMVAELLDKNITILQDDTRYRPFDVQTMACDNRKAISFGWKPRISMKEGLTLTLEWLAKNKVTFKSPIKGGFSPYRNEVLRHAEYH